MKLSDKIKKQDKCCPECGQPDLEIYLPEIIKLEEENERLKKENKQWIKEYNKYDF